MEQALAKIRPHTSSNLAHQKTPATLLIALESTFKDQNTEPSPTAYYAALLTTLDGTVQKKDLGLGDGDILPAELYLLALVAPFVSAPVIRSNLNIVLSLTAPLLAALNEHAPALRSQLSLYQVIFPSLDRSQLETQGMRQIFASALQLCLDPRPKVRKKAAELIKDVLASPPAPLSRHPYSDRAASWIISTLTEVNQTPISRSKPGKAVPTPGTESAIHALATLRQVVKSLPSSSLPEITNLLLSLPRLGNPYLSESTYSILSDLFAIPAENEPTFTNEQITAILNAVLSSPPSKFDVMLSPAWLRVIGSAMVAFSVVDDEGCTQELSKVWKTVWAFLESNDISTREAAVSSLDLLSRCITSSLVDSAITDAEGKSIVAKILARTSKELDSLAFARSVPDLLAVISSLITNLRRKDSTGAVDALLLPLVKQVGDLRIQKGFEYKEDADATLGTAMHMMGPKVLLEVLPLNLEPSDREAGGEPRAYLLPLLAQTHPSPLTHFVSYFVPLSERMFNYQQKAEAEGRQSEAKVWLVLVSQIWAGFAGYCHATVDLKDAMTPQFCQLLSQLLYGQPELRPTVLKALKIMVDSNVALTTPQDGQDIDDASISAEKATENVAFLRTQAESWLAVLFNVFGSVGRDGRSMVGDVISVWASITGAPEITKAYVKVIDMLKTNISKPQASYGAATNDANATVTALDLLLLLLPYLSVDDATTLFQTCLSAPVLTAKDNGIQKRGYKILAKLVDAGKITVDAEAVLKQLDEVADGLAPAAKKDRFNLLSSLIAQIPASAMHQIVSLIPEAVLGTKEPSDKARSAAFDVVLAMGRKMGEGGVVKRSMIDGMDEDEGTDSVASIEEFMTMIAGGLAGASPHMISATVTAISRLLFEFKDQISATMQSEIFTTLLVFLSSANREIVKSILGFIKLAIHTLSTAIIRPYLKDLVPALLNWSHDHKNHFKVKVRHIFERMLRRFGWDEVYSCAGEDDAGKVLLNIKKRKDRAKRKKADRNDDDDEAPAAKPATGDAFEDVLYGSESELDDSDDEDMPNSNKAAQNTSRKQKNNGKNAARLRMDGDEPIDLLKGASLRITNNDSNRRRKPGQDAARFKTDDDTGKMIVNESDSDDGKSNAMAVDPSGSAYRETITSVDGFTRGANGRVKFHKDTKKRRRDNEDIEGDVEMADGETAPAAKTKHRKTTEVKLGHEFKAKKAGGDIKKGGVDPYAYLPLSQAAKKSGRGGKGRIGIAGKR